MPNSEEMRRDIEQRITLFRAALRGKVEGGETRRQSDGSIKGTLSINFGSNAIRELVARQIQPSFDLITNAYAASYNPSLRRVACELQVLAEAFDRDYDPPPVTGEWFSDDGSRKLPDFVVYDAPK